MPCSFLARSPSLTSFCTHSIDHPCMHAHLHTLSRCAVQCACLPIIRRFHPSLRRGLPRSLALLSKLLFNCPSLRRRRRLGRGASARLQKRESDYCKRSRQRARRASLHLVPHLPSSVNERLSGKNVYRVFRFENNWRQLFKAMVTHMCMGRSVAGRASPD